jgi:UDP-N-acetylmuramyl tripeptide synthase
VRWTRAASAACRARRLTYGFDRRADVRAEVRRLGLDGTELAVTTPLGGGTLVTPRVGRRAATEMLGALAFGLAAGVPLATALDTLSRIEKRLRKHGSRRGRRGHRRHRRRDDGHRPRRRRTRSERSGRASRLHAARSRRRSLRRRTGPSARAAADHSDGIFLTVSHSRSEDPAQLALAMVDGLPDVVECDLEFDRVRALRTALLALRSGDALLVVGLGGDAAAIEVGDRLLPCDDRALVRELTGTGVPA